MTTFIKAFKISRNDSREYTLKLVLWTLIISNSEVILLYINN